MIQCQIPAPSLADAEWRHQMKQWSKEREEVSEIVYKKLKKCLKIKNTQKIEQK
jgi:hypothetical protein